MTRGMDCRESKTKLLLEPISQNDLRKGVQGSCRAQTSSGVDHYVQFRIEPMEPPANDEPTMFEVPQTPRRFVE